MASQKKQNQVKKLIEVLSQRSSHFVLINFEKTSHQTFEALRKKLSPFQAKLSVIKNTLFEKAVNQLLTTNHLFIEFKKKCLPLKNPSALLTFSPSSSWHNGLKAFYDFIQQEKSLNFKSGLIDGQVYTRDQILDLARLPSKEQLIHNIIISLRNPLQRFIFSTKFNVNKFVYILKNKN